jgi:FkbM family methyltransferase
MWGVELLRAYGCRVSVIEGQIEVPFRGRSLRFQAESLDKSFGMIIEQFIEEQYKWLRVAGRQVLDLGANIGDSAIYLALNGASHVFALEPYPYTYRLARRNVELNGLEKQVTVLNLGCGKDGTITIDPELKSEPSSNLVQCEAGERVAVVSLKKIVETYELSDAVAKIDCEGGEYELIQGAGDRELRAFSQMMIEYHHGYASLEDRLCKAQFEVRHTRPFTFHNPVTGERESVGFIKAVKREE